MTTKRVYVSIYVVATIAILALVALALTNAISGRFFAIACISIAFALAIVLTLVLRRDVPLNRGRSATSDESIKAKRAKYVRASGIVVFWMVALWLTRDGPVMAQVVGSFMLLLFLIGIMLHDS
jgi:hypothetical protein